MVPLHMDQIKNFKKVSSNYAQHEFLLRQWKTSLA